METKKNTGDSTIFHDNTEAVIILKLLTQMEGQHADLMFTHRSLGARIYTTIAYIWLNEDIMREEEQTGHIHGCKNS